MDKLKVLKAIAWGVGTWASILVYTALSFLVANWAGGQALSGLFTVEPTIALLMGGVVWLTVVVVMWIAAFAGYDAVKTRLFHKVPVYGYRYVFSHYADERKACN